LNITPLLDLAFVLLVIFILTTTPIANDVEAQLPKASKSPKDPPHKATYITVQRDGKMYLNKALLDANGMKDELIGLRFDDPDLSVIVRGDGKTKYKQIRAVLDACQQANVAKVDLATETIDGK
jgi:biopolymer transport protein ExbD